MVQVLQRGRLKQVAVRNLDMHMCFQLKFWSLYNAIMKTTFHIMEITLPPAYLYTKYAYSTRNHCVWRTSGCIRV